MNPSNHLPSISDVLRQVYFDLLQSKDVEDNPTLTYTWIADQGGHFSLGFVPTFVLSWIAESVFKTSEYNLYLGIAVFVVWIVKEVRDFVLAWAVRSNSNSKFPFNKREILLNMATAWLFFAMGSAVATASFYSKEWGLLSLIPSAFLTVFVSWGWLLRKLMFQQATLPFLFRVANFPDNITIPAAAKDDAYKLVEGFYDPNFNEAKHLIISGVPGSGKSSLAVAIGTEFVFRLGLCRYMTLAQLLQYIDPKPKPAPGRKIDAAFEEFDSGRVIWLWDKVNLLIVDDVEDIARVTHDPKQDSDAQNQQVIDMLMKQFRGDHLVQKLKGRPRTIWVCNHPVRPEGLKMILEKLLGYQNISIVHLTDTVEAAKQRK